MYNAVVTEEEKLNKLKQFFSTQRRINYRKRDIIIRAEDTPGGVYYLHKGYVRAYVLSETGQELTLIIFKPGDMFPLIWALNNIPNNYYCEAITSVDVSKISREEFISFLDTNMDVYKEVLSRMLTRMDGLLERMEYMVFGNAYQKIASILLICAERFGLEKENKIIIRVPLTHKDIANLVGLTRETTSAEVKKLEKKNICVREGRLFVVNSMTRLKNEAKWSKPA